MGTEPIPWRGMAALPLRVGKLPPDLLGRLLAQVGPHSADVLLGPTVGEDACALETHTGLLVAAADPVTMTGRDVGRHAVIVNANDVAVTGVRPRWFLATLLLPPGSTPADVEAIMTGIRAGLAEVGAALVGGHTEVTPVVSAPVVSGVMLGTSTTRDFVSTGGARPGDVVVQVGVAPVEGAAVLAVEAAARLSAVSADVVHAAAAAVDSPGISVVDAALAAAELGATALHDPTEGGLASGLHELAAASRVRLRVDPTRIVWFEPGLAVCAAVGADPMAVLASGCLLATFEASRAGHAVDALRAHGWPVERIGTAEVGSGVEDMAGRALSWPDRDEVSRLLEG